MVEQRTENPRVGSSILPLATIQIKALVENDAGVKCQYLLDLVQVVQIAVECGYLCIRELRQILPGARAHDRQRPSP